MQMDGFNDGKHRYGMEHICHHEPNSILIVWLLVLLALVIERLYRLRFLHRGDHAEVSARLLVLNLTNRVYALNFGNPFSGTHFGAPRTIRAEMRIGLR